MLRLFRQYYPIQNIIFFVVEGIIVFSSVLLSTALLTAPGSVWFDFFLILRIAIITLVCQIALYYNDLYDFQVAVSALEVTVRLTQALGVTAIALAAVYYLFPVVTIGQEVFLLSILFMMVFIIGWRVLYIIVLNKGLLNLNVFILGTGELAMAIIHEIQRRIDCGYSIKGIIPEKDELLDNGSFAGELLLTTGIDGLSRVARQSNIKKIVVALKESRGVFPTKALLDCRVAGIDILEGNTFYEMLTGKLLVKRINPSWLIFSDGFRVTRMKKIMKRSGDLVLSLVLLVALLPVFLLVGVLIKLESPGPVFFSQKRVGQWKKEYWMHKFRSMVKDAEKLTGPVWAQSNDQRITRVGSLIRKCRIDELPQLWNVLKGNMSLVGPRPERKHFTDELEELIPYYTERFVVKPGITGWAQVCYDYGASVDDATEKLNYDLFYIKNMSGILDALIILRTIKTVLFGRGAR
ncbi:MAG: TIGR03013 family XrtA/PEP-CTERM system glycosyltransferase [Pseudomonadota bacterium]